MKLETRLQNRRRSAQLRDASRAREAQLDTLRAQLAGELDEFEGRLELALADLPGWAEVDAEQLASLLQVQVEADSLTLGPRVVAYAAARVEAFVREWLVVPAIDPDEGASPDDVARWTGELAALRASLDATRTAAREAASAAEKKLGERLDEVLSALEEQRETDVESLRKKVDEGNAGVGKDARKKEASLWEQQRERASAVREAWTPLEELVFEGVDIAVAGVGQLEALVSDIATDLADAYPELVDVERAPAPTRIRKFAVPPPLPQIRDASSPSFTVDDARRVTEPLSPYETEELAREVFAPTPGTEPPVTRVEARTPAPAPRPTPRQPARTTPPGHRILDETTYRIRSGWQPVRLVESATVLLPVIGYTIVLLVFSVLHQLGLAANPFHLSDIILPLWLGGAGCVFILPAILGWRVIWSPDWRPRFVRWQRRREDTVLRLDADGLRLADSLVAWNDASAMLRKSSRVEPTWVLEVDGPHVHLFFAAEATPNEWTRRRVPDASGVPLNAWHIREDTLLEISRRAVS